MCADAARIVRTMTISTSHRPGVAASGEALTPAGWNTTVGLVCGFGDRRATAPAGTVLLRRQVHGSSVVELAGQRDRLVRDAGDDFPRVAADADALVADDGRVVGVRTADCVPLLLVAPRLRWASAVHAGWRGTVAGIAREAVRAAREAGVRPDELLAALGPSIGPCCYEVSPELGEEFRRADLPVVAATDAPGARPHLDLRAANAVLLERSGVAAQNVQLVGPCTRCRSDLYHSYRAEPDSMGRQVSWIGWDAPADRRPPRDPAPRR